MTMTWDGVAFVSLQGFSKLAVGMWGFEMPLAVKHCPASVVANDKR